MLGAMLDGAGVVDSGVLQTVRKEYYKELRCSLTTLYYRKLINFISLLFTLKTDLL
jgi:hypothetical protein